MSLATTLMAVGVPAETANRIGYADRVPLDGAGTTQLGATEILRDNTNIAMGTSVGDTAFILPAEAEFFQPYFLLNTTAETALIFPPVGDTIDANALNSAVEIETDLARVLMRVEEGRWVSMPSGEGGGGIETIGAGPGISVDITDPDNPVVSNTGVLSVTAGTNVTITGTAQNPVINSSNPGGTVTAVSVATANGFAGSSSGGATPALTLSTTVNAPALAGNGTAMAAATTTGTGATVVLSASPALTGTPTAPTAAVDTSTTQIATTAMVIGQAASATPLGDMPTAVVGSSSRYARADHVHPGRERLTANRDYYVNGSTGSNSNNGLSLGAPFLTIQKALDVVAALDIATFNVTINVADATYTTANSVTGAWLGSGTVSILGNTSTPANVIINPSGSCFLTQNGGRLTISGVELRGNVGVQSSGGSSLTVSSSVRFGAATAYQVYADGGTITFAANYSIVGGAISHMVAGSGGKIVATSKTITLTGTPAFSGTFCQANGPGALCEVYLNTYSGSATGSRYSAANGGFISVNGASTTYLPGNAAGSGTNFGASPWGLYS